MRISTKQLCVISLLVAVGAVVRVGLNKLAFALPIPVYSVLIKIGLSETLAFICGFVFGSVQGFVTGALTIIVSDLFTWAGIWTPFIAAIIGLLGFVGGVLGHFKGDPSRVLLGVTAVILTVMSELLQTLWFAWYLWAFYMPEISFLIVFATALIEGVSSTITALISNTILFTALAPRVIEILREWVMPNPGTHSSCGFGTS